MVGMEKVVAAAGVVVVVVEEPVADVSDMVEVAWEQFGVAVRQRRSVKAWIKVREAGRG